MSVVLLIRARRCSIVAPWLLHGSLMVDSCFIRVSFVFSLISRRLIRLGGYDMIIFQHTILKMKQ